MTPELSTVNKFLAAAAASGVSRTPTEYFVYTTVRMNSLGYTVTKDRNTDLTTEYGDVYMELDQWHDALDSNSNQLEKRFGEKYFYNLIWVNYGEQLAAQIVSDSDIASQEDSFYTVQIKV